MKCADKEKKEKKGGGEKKKYASHFSQKKLKKLFRNHCWLNRADYYLLYEKHKYSD